MRMAHAADTGDEEGQARFGTTILYSNDLTIEMHAYSG